MKVNFNMRKQQALTFLLFLMITSMGISQDMIYLTNPSFEDQPRHSQPPANWADCGFSGESPPDVQPSGDFGVYREASAGNTYLGMVVRENETFERVSQRLSKPFQVGKCYEFSLALVKSRYYISPTSSRPDEYTNYTTPVKIRIWGGYQNCKPKQMLDDTEPVAHYDWRTYNFKLEPDAAYTHIFIEAFYDTPVMFPYNGNILVDDASPIKVIPCDEEVPDEPEFIDEPVLAEEVITTPRTPTPSPAPQQNPSPPTPQEPTPTPVTPEPQADKEIAGVKRSEMKTGIEIQLDNVFFEADSSRIRKESTEALDEVYDFLLTYNDVVIEIGGHTNSYPPAEYCDRLSEARAKAVSEYLAAKGINRERLKYKGYGKRKPIASNQTISGRRKNQRVEIKILEMKGG